MSRSLAFVAASLFLALSCCPTGNTCAQVFSLDDNPTAPLTTPLPTGGSAPFGPFGLGAEDPYGLAPPGVAPSPSLAPPTVGPWIDGDLLFAGNAAPGEPELNVPAPVDGGFGTGIPHTFLNAVSNNSSPTQAPAIHLAFSVDRASVGAPGSASAVEAGLFQHPADIYLSTSTFAPPNLFVGQLPPAAGFMPGPINPPSPHPNVLILDESNFDLTPGLPPGPGGQLPPGIQAPPIGPGTHDNIDAFEFRLIDNNGDGIEDIGYYFTINPDDAIDKQYFMAPAPPPYDSANIRFVAPGAMGADAIYALSGALGLTPSPILPVAPAIGSNDIDALVVWDPDQDGLATAGIDFALFSLAPGSVDLGLFGNSPADIFFTDFSGTYTTYALAMDLGLLPTDNVDALEMVIPGDLDFNGKLDGQDLIVLRHLYGLQGGWLEGDFDGNGEVGLSDLVIFAMNQNSMTAAATSIPEPTSWVLMLGVLVGAAICRCRCKTQARVGRIGLWVGGSTFCALSVFAAANARAANVTVTTSNLGNGLFQHVLNVEILTGDLLGIELTVVDPQGRINDIDAFSGGLNTVFADDAAQLTTTGHSPAEDTHALYNRTEGIHVPGIVGGMQLLDGANEFSVATGAFAGAPLITGAPGATRDMFQLVTQGNIAVTAERLRLNVAGAGDLIFDGFVVQQPPPPGDFNLDGLRNGHDFLMWQRGESPNPGDPGDLADWEANYGVAVPTQVAIAAVPEPATCLALVVGTAILVAGTRNAPV